MRRNVREDRGKKPGLIGNLGKFENHKHIEAPYHILNL